MATTTTLLAPATLPLEHVIPKKERINPDVLTRLVSHPDLSEETRTALRAYQKRVKDGRVEVQYTLGYKVKGAEEYSGRYYARGGTTLQNFPREVRNLLAGEYYDDVDFKNAQPSIALQMAQKNGLVCRTLAEYCEERETLLGTFHPQREKAKKMAMTALYGGSTDGMPPFLQRLGEEMRTLLQTLVRLYRENVPPTLRKNSVPSLGSYLLQTEEKKCLLEAEKALNRRGFVMEVLIHDGGLVAKREEPLTPAILREVEKEVADATGYTMELALKPMDSTLTLEGVEDDYRVKKTEFEKTHFKILSPFQFAHLDGDNIQTFSQNDLRGRYHNMLLRDGTSFIEKWLLDPSILTYKKMVFAPMCEPPVGCFNTFLGWRVKPKKGGDTAVYHILLNLMVRHNPAHKDWLFKYHAHIVQKPYEKTGVCVVYCSEQQGTGKDTHNDAFANLLGAQYTSNTGDPANNWFGRFTAHMERCVYAKCEELAFADSKAHANRFKSNITATEVTYEAKGITPYNAPSYTNYAATTNNPVSVLLEDKERRFVLFNPSDEKAGDHAFWEWVHAELAKPEVQAAYMDELMSADLTGFHPRKNRPITELYESNTIAQAPFHAKFFQFALESESLPIGWITGHDLAKRINDYLARYCPNYPARTPQAIGKALLPYMEAGAIQKERRNYGFVYLMDAEPLHAYLLKQKWWSGM